MFDLPKLIGDGMVLQREPRVSVWGWADPEEAVRIAFRGIEVITKADRIGRWSASMGPFGAGGPYDMTVKGKNEISVRNILLGDVWVASGQSNMEFPLNGGAEEWMTGVLDADLEAAGANFPSIRLPKIHRQFALTPQNDVEADAWTAMTPGTVGHFWPQHICFGRELHQRYHVPIGLIESS
jgi:sialate O-acetylesterase